MTYGDDKVLKKITSPTFLTNFQFHFIVNKEIRCSFKRKKSIKEKNNIVKISSTLYNTIFSLFFYRLIFQKTLKRAKTTYMVVMVDFPVCCSDKNDRSRLLLFSLFMKNSNKIYKKLKTFDFVSL